MLRRLSNACGVSGSEGEVRAIIKELAALYASDMKVDHLGNLYVHKKGRGRRIMLAAHMDEVGMRVTGVLDSGLLAYDNAGLDSRVVVSKRVVIGKGKVPGVIGSKAIHLQKRTDLDKKLPHEELFIDIGAKDKEDALKYVSVGDFVCFDTEFEFFGDGLMKGKALDDRIGCAVLLELLKKDYDCDLYAVFTVQEEVGLRGATVAAYTVEPELALVFEGTTANDMPDAKGHEHVTKVGKGPAITFMDGATITKKKMLDALIDTAKEAGIPFQMRQGTKGGTDAGRIHRAKAGAITGGISVPCRYIHSPVSVASVSDFENAVKLADAFLTTKKFERC